jgi:radical SAM protein (TIGR01212 family)
MFLYTYNNKRYHTLDYHYKNKYQEKVFKVSLNANFTCPNIDGTVGVGGCIYCSKSGSGEFGGNKDHDISKQFEEIKQVMHKKWPKAKYIGYFQARTNTYAPVERLKEVYEPILQKENVVGLNIATRADAISKECYDYLEDLNKRTDLTIELGLQTAKEETSKLINRCHTLECFEQAVKELRKRKIDVVVHIINGLPYETKEDMINTVKYLNKLDIQGIKIHMLSVIKDTPLEKLIKEKKIPILSKEEYIDIVVDQLEQLRPEIVIHRITGDPDPKELVEPQWLIKKFCVLNDIDKEMVRRDTYQGAKC